MDLPRKYREPGDKRPIYVGLYTESTGVTGYKLLQNNSARVATPYKGIDGTSEIKYKIWRTEAEAQSYLDHLARVRKWRQVR